jgi:DNA transformation protein
MSVSREFIDWVQELLAPLGRVAPRRMFGGYGLFLDGLMFAIVVDDVVWFKTDAQNRERFVALGEPPFTYQRGGKPAHLHFYRAPDDAFDAPQALMPWARSAFEAALRASHANAVRQLCKAAK